MKKKIEMKLFYFLLVMMMLSFGCARSSIEGVYRNNCILYHVPEAYVEIKHNGVFVYVYPYFKGIQIEGSWEIKKDTLVLNSEFFVRENGKDTVRKENTFAHFEPLLYKRKRIYEITTNAYRKQKCYFNKIKNIQPGVLSGL